jgi:hypothetical protein
VGKIHLSRQANHRSRLPVGAQMNRNPRTIFLALIIVGLIWGPQMVAAEPRANQAPILVSRSAINQVPDFSVEGVGNGYSLKITSQGGYLSTSSSSIMLTPWGHVIGQWGTEAVDIIFLVNVTQSDFYIGFLYVTNSSSRVVLRTFEYEGGLVKTIVVQGSQRISNRMVYTTPIPMPKVHLDVKAQTDNGLAVIGPEMYMVGDYGTLLNGSTTLKVAALRNQLFNGANEYNELWSLLTDDSGDYYFAIMYMKNSDTNHVIFEHQIRLNDLQTLGGRTISARWTHGHFSHSVTVRLPGFSSTVKVNGFPFQTNNNGVLSVEVAHSWATVEVPSEVGRSDDTRLSFSSWGSYGTANPLNVTLNPRVDLKADYATEYRLTIDGPYGNVTGAGWYLQGANASFSVSPLVDSGNGTRRVFVGFSGSQNSSSNSAWLVMDSPKRVSVDWKTQQAVTLELSGVPANSTVAVNVNGITRSLSGAGQTELWVDNDARLNVDVQTTEIKEPTIVYNFTEIQVDGQVSGPSVRITKPIVVSIVFSGQEEAQSAITLQVDPQSPISGYPVKITGSLPTKSKSSAVSLFYSADKVNWQPIAIVPIGQGGSFSYVWTPKASGSYFVRAYSQGDAQRAASSEVVPVKVQNELPAGIHSLRGLPQLIQGITQRVDRVPIVSLLLELARSLLLLGIVLTTLLLPTSPPIIGYFVGSLFVGLVFVFPISTIVLTFSALRKRRSPSAIWLIPLLTIWIAALVLLLAGGPLSAIPQALLAASTILLVSSNALLVPLAFSLLVAKAIVS